MRATLFDHLEAPPAPVRVRLRERRHPCGTYVRKVKGELYQLRWWLEGYGSVNCGLYDETNAERVRGRLASESGRHSPTPLGLWKALCVVLERLRGERPGSEWPHVLPMWVKALAGGRESGAGYWAKVKKGGVVVELPGPFETPEAAHIAMSLRLAEQFPKVKRERAERLSLADFMTAA